MSGWGKLPEQVKQDLEAWFNCTEITYDQKTELARLYQSGRFHAWNCPECGERTYFSNPKNWAMFQGVLNADYSSYPGNPRKWTQEYLERLCDSCRNATSQHEFDKETHYR